MISTLKRLTGSSRSVRRRVIAMYAVLRPPILNADFNKPGQTVTAADYTNNHLPADSTLLL